MNCGTCPELEEDCCTYDSSNKELVCYRRFKNRSDTLTPVNQMCSNIQCDTNDCKTMIYNSNTTLYRAGGTGFTKCNRKVTYRKR